MRFAVADGAIRQFDSNDERVRAISLGGGVAEALAQRDGASGWIVRREMGRGWARGDCNYE
jgi:hypothetical protein